MLKTCEEKNAPFCILDLGGRGGLSVPFKKYEIVSANYPPNVWKDSIAFYLDGVPFVYRTNPLDQAHAPKGRVWRRKSKGLTQLCLAKGRKAGTEGKVAKFMFAATYGREVLVCER